MKEVLKKDSSVARVLKPQRLSPDCNYRKSDFMYIHYKNDLRCLYNTLTKQCYVLENENYDFDADLFTYNRIAEDENLAQLVSDYFLVPEETDEDKIYENVIDIVSVLKQKKQKKGYSSYVIMPTTACNARCFYCFEQGMKIVTMTPEIVDRTIEYILSTKQDGKIFLKWFGGEPLIGKEIIKDICLSLKNNNVEFSSTITTNGSLVNENLLSEMVELWNVKRIQITLDGNEKEYNKRKNYRDMSVSPYSLVMNGIELLLKHDIYVHLRFNIDADNLYCMEELVESIASRFKDKSHLSGNFALLYDLLGDKNNLWMIKKMEELKEKLNETGFINSIGSKLNLFRIDYCIANETKKNVVITPDGKLYNCEHCLPDTSFGNIFDGVTNRAIVEKYAEHPPVSEKCSGCVFLPECTTFSLCPIKNANCKEMQELNLKQSLNYRLEKEELNQ